MAIDQPFQEIILIDDEYLKSLLIEIQNATSTIDLEVYIFEEDAVGELIGQALCQAAKRGVKIRILVDGIGSLSWGGRLTQQIESCGIHTKIFHPFPLKLTHFSRSTISTRFSKIFTLIQQLNRRNHRKVCIIDSKIAFIGSANINNHLVTNNSNKKWRETCVKLTGVNISELQYAFDKAWGGFSLTKKFRNYFKEKKDISIFYMNYSWLRRYKYYEVILKKINQSKKRIWVTNAYFVPDINLLKKLIKASKRGVDVRILLPEKSDVLIMSIASAMFYEKLIKSGILLFAYLPTILHSKILIIDDWYLIGSSNLNSRSFHHDLEVNVVISADENKKIIEQQFFADLQQSRQLDKNDTDKQSFFKKILARLILLLRYWI